MCLFSNVVLLDKMKYGEYLKNNLTNEWSSQYIQYEDFKEFLYEIQKDFLSSNQRLSSEQYYLHTDQEFFQYCEKELIKINTFYAEKLAESLLRFDVLKNEYEYFEEKVHLTIENPSYINARNSSPISFKFQRSNSKIFLKKYSKNRKLKLNDLKLCFSEFYLMLILLKNYQTLNYQGFCKILKKHDKLFQTTRGFQWKKSSVDCALFKQSLKVDELINEVENFYIIKLEKGDRNRSMSRLRVPPLEEKQSSYVTFRLGIFFGMIFLLILLLIYLLLKSNNWREGLHLYRSLFLLIMEIFFFGLNVYIWSKTGVNHILIFEIDPRKHLTYQIYLEISTFLLVLWLISLNLFFYLNLINYYPYIQPLILLIILILILINPLKIFYKTSRYWLIKKIFRVFLSPYYSVEFVDFWLADQFCSLELVFFDLEYFICLSQRLTNWNLLNNNLNNDILFCNGSSQIILQSFLLILPSWFRFLQCLRRYKDTKQKFPHLINAGKYSTSFFLILTNSLRRAKYFNYHQNKYENPFLYLWILTSFISSTYKFIWDIKMDWSLGDKTSQYNRYLREQLIYQQKYFYYLSILFNWIFRYIWIINIFLQYNSYFTEYSDIIGFIFAFIELFRRFIWNFFRLENEHLNNCGQFRAIRDISIRPTNFSLNHSQRTTQDIPMIQLNHFQTNNTDECLQEINTILTNRQTSFQNS